MRTSVTKLHAPTLVLRLGLISRKKVGPNSCGPYILSLTLSKSTFKWCVNWPRTDESPDSLYWSNVDWLDSLGSSPWPRLGGPRHASLFPNAIGYIEQRTCRLYINHCMTRAQIQHGLDKLEVENWSGIITALPLERDNFVTHKKTLALPVPRHCHW